MNIKCRLICALFCAISLYCSSPVEVQVPTPLKYNTRRNLIAQVLHTCNDNADEYLRSEYSNHSREWGWFRSQLSWWAQQEMSEKPSIVVTSYKRRRQSSGSSECGGDSSPTRKSENETIKLGDKMSSAGGFTFFDMGGELSRNIYVFPTKLLSSKDRENVVKQFVAKLYDLYGDYTEEVNKILVRITPEKECNITHTFEHCKIGPLSNNVDILPADGFRRPEVKLANSTPGPRLSKVRDVCTVRSPSDSLRVINHLQLSDDDCRYVRGISLLGLAT